MPAWQVSDHGLPTLRLALDHPNRVAAGLPGALAPGFDAVQIAGDPERATRVARREEGITVDDQTWQEILDAGAKVGVAA